VSATPRAAPVEAAVAAAAEALRRARSVLFVTGAGVSADSGLPTYRGVGGLYDDADTPEGLPIEVALSGEMLERDPALCWKYLAQIGRATQGAEPNAAHRVMAAVERRCERAWVLTQNVDGLHRAAGSQNVIEIHGAAGRLLCTRCTWRGVTGDYERITLPPACPRCGALARPDVVLFGERLPAAALADLDRELAEGFELVFSVGTSSLFPYIELPVHAARRSGATTVEINPARTPVSDLVTHRIALGAAEALEAIWRRVGELDRAAAR
jgi:NAD-dependent deacetylase